MDSKPYYTIQQVEKYNKQQVISFMMRIRKEVFPMLAEDELPPDLVQFEECYMDQKKAIVYAALSPDGEVLGTIGVQMYDGRFTELARYYQQMQTAEIVKCYIDPKYRRLRVGTALFNEAVEFAKEVGYDMLYLHTHPFLPGAIPFWKAKGFQTRLQDKDPVWKTLHMDMRL